MPTDLGRRDLCRTLAAAAGSATLPPSPLAPSVARAQAAGPLPGSSRVFDLVVENRTANFTGCGRPAIAVNGTIPGPLLHFREGEDVVVNVTNWLDEPASIYWQGLILPSAVDGVPGISDGFSGIAPGITVAAGSCSTPGMCRMNPISRAWRASGPGTAPRLGGGPIVSATPCRGVP